VKQNDGEGTKNKKLCWFDYFLNTIYQLKKKSKKNQIVLYNNIKKEKNCDCQFFSLILVVGGGVKSIEYVIYLI